MSNGRILIGELKLLLSGIDNLLNVIILFILMISVALFTIKDTEIIKVLPIILWICSISTVHMSMCHLFGNDYGNGSLEQILIQDCIPELVVFLKYCHTDLCWGTCEPYFCIYRFCSFR